jgi:hypothetical protein
MHTWDRDLLHQMRRKALWMCIEEACTYVLVQKAFHLFTNISRHVSIRIFFTGNRIPFRFDKGMFSVCIPSNLNYLIIYSQTRNFVLDTEPPPPASSSTTKQQKSRQKGDSSRKDKRRPSHSRMERRKTREADDDEDHHPSDPELFDDYNLEAVEDGDFEPGEDSQVGTEKSTSVDVKMEEDEQGLDSRPSRYHEAGKASRVEDTGTSLDTGDDDEPKPKLTLELKYRAFSNFNRCLCVVVEPWPPQRSDTRAPSLAPSTKTRASSVALDASESSTNYAQRAKTPLFLPDLDDEPTTLNPSHFRTLPPVPLFNDRPTGGDADDVEEWGDSTALMQFSQMLNATGRVSGGDVEDEDEFDGTVLFADADEAKEL